VREKGYLLKEVDFYLSRGGKGEFVRIVSSVKGGRISSARRKNAGLEIFPGRGKWGVKGTTPFSLKTDDPERTYTLLS